MEHGIWYRERIVIATTMQTKLLVATTVTTFGGYILDGRVMVMWLS